MAIQFGFVVLFFMGFIFGFNESRENSHISEY